MKLVSIAVLAILSTTAYAGSHDSPKDCPPKGGKSSGAPSQTLSGSQGQGQSQSNGQGQDQSAAGGSSDAHGGNATGGSATGGNGGTGGSGGTGTGVAAADANGSSSNSYTNINPRAPVNSAFATPGMTTAGCRFSDAIGVSSFVVGLSFSKSRADTDCRKVEMANSLYARGLLWAGNKVTCAVSYVHDALGADCEALLLMPEHKVADDEGRVYKPDAVTHQELRAVEDRIVAAATRK